MILQFFGLEWPLYHSYKNPPSVIVQSTPLATSSFHIDIVTSTYHRNNGAAYIPPLPFGQAQVITQ